MLAYWQKYRHSFWSAFLLFIRALAGLGSQKVVAIFFGPGGTTLFSHFQNLLALFTQPIQDSVGNGLISAFSKKALKKDQLIGAAIIILLLLISVTGVFLFVSSQFRKSIFTFSTQHWLLILPSIILFCFGLIVAALYIVKQKLKLYSFIIFIQWAFFFMVTFAVELELEQLLTYWLVNQAVFTIVLVYPMLSYLKVDFSIAKELRDHFKQFLIMALTIWISTKCMNYFIREFAIHEYGSVQTGLWQSVVKVSEAYRGLLVSFLFLTFYPMITRVIAANNLDLSLIRKYYLPYLLLSFAFLALVFHYDQILLKVLYSSAYEVADKLFKFQIIGDLFAFLSLPFSVYLIASTQTKTYIFTELVSAFIFVSLVIVKSSVGIEILVYAHIVRFIFFLFMVGFVGIKDLRNEG